MSHPVLFVFKRLLQKIRKILSTLHFINIRLLIPTQNIKNYLHNQQQFFIIVLILKRLKGSLRKLNRIKTQFQSQSIQRYSNKFKLIRLAISQLHYLFPYSLIPPWRMNHCVRILAINSPIILRNKVQEIQTFINRCICQVVVVHRLSKYVLVNLGLCL